MLLSKVVSDNQDKGQPEWQIKFPAGNNDQFHGRHDSTGKTDINRSHVHILPGKPFHKCQAREKELSSMSSMYESMNDSHDPVLTTLYLTGLPGSGKTELARQFGVQFSKNTQNCENNSSLVLTLSAESTQSLLKSAQSVASKIGLVRKLDKAEGIEEVDLARFYLEDLRELLQKYPSDWLLILDNVRSGEKINSILPQAGSKDWGRGKVLVTSQDNDIVPICHEYAQRYSLNDGMSKEDALGLLQKVSGVAVDDFADQLTKELNHLPLSLACTATYVGKIVVGSSPRDFSWSKFLDIYHEHEEKNEVNYEAFTKFNIYPYSMAVVAKLAAKRMAERNEILRLTFDFLSYCALDPVPLAVVSSYVKSCLTANIPLAEIEDEIYSCSLLLSDHSGFRQIITIKFHQVIGKAFKSARDERDFHLNELEMRDRFVSILKSINTSLEPAVWGSATPDDVALQILMSPHLQSFVTYGKSKNWNMSEEFVVLSVNVARCLYHISGVTDNQRVKYLEEAYSVAQELKLEGIKYCYLLANLGFYFRELHQLEKSEQILKQALLMTMKCQDTKEWLSLKSYILKILSWTYKLLQKLDVAVEKMKQSIAVAKQAYGEDHEEIVERLCAISFIYRDKYEMEKAKEAVDMARDIALRKTDEFDLKRAEAMCDSGKIYLSCADREDNAAWKEKLLRSSKEFHEKALEIYEKVLGKNHISVARGLITYAAVCKELEQFLEAMKYIERAEIIYNIYHHEIGLSFALSYKADILLAIGKVEKAKCLLSNSVGARFLLASLYLRKKKFFKAKAMFQDMLADCKLGKSPPSHRWIDQAGMFMAECDRETSKMFLPILLVFGFVCVLLISVLLAYWMTK